MHLLLSPLLLHVPMEVGRQHMLWRPLLLTPVGMKIGMEYVALVLRLLLGAVCLVAAVAKVRRADALRSFGRTLAAVGVRPGLVWPVAACVIGAEVAVAVLAPWPRTGVAGMLVATVLMAALTAGVAGAVRRGTTATCACFGRGDSRLGNAHVVRNGALLCLAMLALGVSAGTGPVGLEPPGIALSAVVAAAGVLVTVYWEDLLPRTRRY